MDSHLLKKYQILVAEREQARLEASDYIKEGSSIASNRAFRRSDTHLKLVKFLEGLKDFELDYLLVERFVDMESNGLERENKIARLLGVSNPL